jgi:hypothetical protein
MVPYEALQGFYNKASNIRYQNTSKKDRSNWVAQRSSQLTLSVTKTLI